MKKLCFAMLLCMTATQLQAQEEAATKSRKNPFTVGFMIGPSSVYSNVPSGINYSYNKDAFDLGSAFNITFAAESYFNKAHNKVYFSLGGRLMTTYFETQYYSYPTIGGTYPTYPIYRGGTHILVGSLGASAGLNWDIVRGKNAALTTQLAAVPMAEAGNFKDNYGGNVAGELYLGGTFMKKVSLGFRVSHRFMSYEYESIAPYVSPTYTVTNYSFDLRFRINGGGNNGSRMMSHMKN